MNFAALRHWAKQLKQQTLTVYFAARDPRTPGYVRCLALFVAAYALSPIDLIPDFIPIFGYLDDLILVPLGLALIIHLTPANIIADAQLRAAAQVAAPRSYVMAGIVIVVWTLMLVLLGLWLTRFYSDT